MIINKFSCRSFDSNNCLLILSAFLFIINPPLNIKENSNKTPSKDECEWKRNWKKWHRIIKLWGMLEMVKLSINVWFLFHLLLLYLEVLYLIFTFIISLCENILFWWFYYIFIFPLFFFLFSVIIINKFYFNSVNLQQFVYWMQSLYLFDAAFCAFLYNYVIDW